jgi:hypothetical protein
VSVRRYDFHGVRLDVDTDDDAIGEAIDARLRHFRAAGEGEADVRHEVRIAARHAIRRPDGEGRPVYDPPEGEVSYFASGDALWIDVSGRVQVLATPGLTQVSATPAAAAELWLLTRPMLTIPLVEQLKRRGLYCLHAGAAARAGRALLLPGPSGSGKSTLALALADAGWDFMADDMVFMDRDLQVRAFPDEVDLSPRSASWFPALGELGGTPPDGWPKHRVRIEDVLGCDVRMSATPAALAFPAPGASERSVLEPADPGRALLALAPNVLLPEPESTQAHLDVLGELARRTPAHELVTGRDFSALAARLAQLLA